MDFHSMEGENYFFRKSLTNAMEFSNSTHNLNKKCLEFYKNETWKCYFPDYFLKFIETPIFITNSFYDVMNVKFNKGDYFNISTIEQVEYINYI